MKSKCCNKPLRLSRENPEPGETMFYICDGCNQPADPKCDHGDHIVCNECMKPAGDVPDCYLRKETMISDSAHSYQLGYAKGKQEERKKVLSEVEELECVDCYSHGERVGYGMAIKDVLDILEKARE